MWHHYIGETRVKRCLCWCFRCPTMLPSLLAPKVGASVFEDNSTIQWNGHFFGDSWVVFFPYFFVCNYETIGAGDGTGWNMMDMERIKNRLADTLQTATPARLLARSSAAPWRDESCWTRARLDHVLLEMPRKWWRYVKIQGTKMHKASVRQAARCSVTSSHRNPAHYTAKSKLQHEQWHPKEWMVFSLMQVPKVGLKHLHSKYQDTSQFVDSMTASSAIKKPHFRQWSLSDSS